MVWQGRLSGRVLQSCSSLAIPRIGRADSKGLEEALDHGFPQLRKPGASCNQINVVSNEEDPCFLWTILVLLASVPDLASGVALQGCWLHALGFDSEIIHQACSDEIEQFVSR